MLDTSSFMFSFGATLFGSFTLGIYIIYIFFIHPIFVHPLRHIPRAHWSVAIPYFGSLWVSYQRYCQRSNATTLDAHRIHGDVVRLGYEEISINCIKDGVRTVYGGGWDKTDYYAKKFGSFGVTNMFTTVHSAPRSQKKRRLAHIYSKSYLHTSEQLNQNGKYLLARRILPLLQSRSDKGETIDFFELNQAFTLDFSSAYIFGLKCSTNTIDNVHARKELMHNYRVRHDGEWQQTEIAPWLHRWLRGLRIPGVPRSGVVAKSWLEKWTMTMCEPADEYLLQPTHRTENEYSGNDPVVYKHFRNGMKELRTKDPHAGRDFLPHVFNTGQFTKSNNGLESMSQHELYSEMYDHLAAGHTTSTTSLTYLHWELSRNPTIQDKLHEELSQPTAPIIWPPPSSSSSSTINSIEGFHLPTHKQIDSLPYLNAIIKETLRLHAPIPGSQPRISPHNKTGHKLGTNGKSFSIPGGITVSAMAYTLHLNPSVFSDPEVFIPERWLTDEIKEMNFHFWPFSGGSGMCIGSHFAILMMKLFVVAIYSNWRTEIADDDEGMEKVDGYTTKPKGERLVLRLSRR